ncbi:MAG: hypothetical protein ABEJ93_01645 [Candidatus Nanohalobium sp.]
MTTVTISSETHRKLKRLKKEKGTDSFDRLLDELAEEELEVPSVDEMFGSGKVGDKEIRDRDDRIDRYE